MDILKAISLLIVIFCIHPNNNNNNNNNNNEGGIYIIYISLSTVVLNSRDW